MKQTVFVSLATQHHHDTTRELDQHPIWTAQEENNLQDEEPSDADNARHEALHPSLLRPAMELKFRRDGDSPNPKPEP